MAVGKTCNKYITNNKCDKHPWLLDDRIWIKRPDKVEIYLNQILFTDHHNYI